MTWVRIDDQFSDHPKVLDVGPLAECLFVRGLTYAARYLTDGFVPLSHLRRMGDLDGPGEAERLVAAGLWEPSENGFQIHDYLDYQPSAEKVKAEREANAKRQADWRDRKRDAKPLRGRESQGSNGVTHAVTNTPSNGHVTGAPYPSHTQPDQTGDTPPSGSPHGADAPPPPEKPQRVRRKPEIPMPDDFELDGDHLAYALAEGLSERAARHEFAKFRNNAQATDRRQADWAASWRTWVLKSFDYGAGRDRASPVPIRGSTAGHAERSRAAADEAKALLRERRRPPDDDAIETAGRVGR